MNSMSARPLSSVFTPAFDDSGWPADAGPHEPPDGRAFTSGLSDLSRAVGSDVTLAGRTSVAPSFSFLPRVQSTRLYRRTSVACFALPYTAFAMSSHV